MKIFLDPTIFYMQNFGGVSRYYTEIFSILRKKEDVKLIFPYYHSENVYVNNSPLKPNNKLRVVFFKILSFLNISTKTVRAKQANKLLSSALSNTSFDLVIPTFYNPYFLKSVPDKPFVLTVYDMIHELFPHYFTDDVYNVIENKLMLMEKASMIIAVSQNTKSDILKIYPHIDASKIEVIYHGSSIKLNAIINVQLPHKYILFVGERSKYKNFNFFIKAIEPLLKANSDLMLVCAGGNDFNPDELFLINDLGLHNQVIYKSFQENELGHFYKNALCFVFPSLYEGFGIPVLESMACGCPVVLAANSSFPEVAGDAGVYFNLHSAHDLKNKIKWLLENEDVRNHFSALGLKQITKFDWNIAAEQCFKVYKQAVEKNCLR